MNKKIILLSVFLITTHNAIKAATLADQQAINEDAFLKWDSLKKKWAKLYNQKTPAQSETLEQHFEKRSHPPTMPTPKQSLPKKESFFNRYGYSISLITGASLLLWMDYLLTKKENEIKKLKEQLEQTTNKENATTLHKTTIQ